MVLRWGSQLDGRVCSWVVLSTAVLDFLQKKTGIKEAIGGWQESVVAGL
jgi:hypothetical protein